MSRVCVIGAGLGGLSLAIRLQSSGIETVLVEARGEPGGHAAAVVREGFTFDAGPSDPGDPAAFAELWQLAGHDMAGDVELLPVEPLWRLKWTDGGSLDISRDEAAMRREIARIAPDDAAGYEEFLRWAGQAIKDGADGRLLPPGAGLAAIAKAAPMLARYQAWRPVYSLVSGYVKSEKLREAFTVQALMAGANPMKASGLQALAHKREIASGVWWPKGGMHRLPAALAKLYERIGGRLLLHDPVLHIHTLGDRASEVETVSGWRERFDAVASNADLVHSYRDLLAGSERGPEMARRLIRQRFSPGLFTVHFGLEGSWPGIPHNSVLFGPRYKGLLEDIFEHGVLPRDQIIFLQHPTVTDPTVAPPGKSTFRATIPVANQAKLPIDWDQSGPLIERRILEEVGRRLIPDIDDRIAVKFHTAPRDAALELSSWAGSGFGLEPVLGQSLLLRLPVRDARIRNLYFAGAGIQPGGGVAGALASAKAAAKQMQDDLREGRA